MKKSTMYLVPEDVFLGILNYLVQNRPMSEVEGAVAAMRQCKAVTPEEEEHSD